MVAPPASLPADFVAKISEEDPGVVVMWNEAGVAAHAAQVGMNPPVLQQAVAAAIIGAGMTAAEEHRVAGASRSLFSGSMAAVMRAMDAVSAIAAARHWPPVAGQQGIIPDVGTFYVVTPLRGGLDYAPAYHMFNPV